MDRRLKLDAEFRELLTDLYGYETEHLYFQPTEAVRMKYDAIVYKRTSFGVQYADDQSHFIRDQYEVIAITQDPDATLPREIQSHFKFCKPGKQYVADNLYHFPFTIYY